MLFTFPRRPALRALPIGILLAALAWSLHAPPAKAADYAPHQVIVGYERGASEALASTAEAHLGLRRLAPAPAPRSRVLRLAPGVSVTAAAARLRRQPGVAYAEPNYIAHTAGAFYPNDRGRANINQGWQKLQWNMLPAAGVDAPRAWSNLLADGQPGGRGVTVAILDTGVAYRNWKQFDRSPDFTNTKFVAPYDFVDKNAYPLDREGHGTFVAGVVAESTNNKLDLTGLAYGASIMPVRVLDAQGEGDETTIARGIRYAASHGAQDHQPEPRVPPDPGQVGQGHPGDRLARSSSRAARA